MVNAEKISKVGNEDNVTSISRIKMLEHSNPIDCAASNKHNISNEKENTQNETETQALDKPLNMCRLENAIIVNERNIGMEPNFPTSDINEWRTVSNSRRKNRMQNINTYRENRNLKIPSKESKYKIVNFSSNLKEERFDAREYKNVVKDKSHQKILHDSSVGKVPRFTKFGNPRRTARRDVAYEDTTEFLSSKNKIHNLNQEFVENSWVETCVTASVQNTKELDFSFENEIEQSKSSELNKAPMKYSYAEKCISNVNLTERQFKNKGAFHKNSRPEQNCRNEVHQNKRNGLDITKSKKQEKTEDIIAKSELCVINKKMVNKSLGIDGTINEEQLNKHEKVIDLLKPDHNKVKDVININEQNQNVAASLKNEEILNSRKTVGAHDNEPNQLDLAKRTLIKREKIDKSVVSKSESCVMTKKTVNKKLDSSDTINKNQLNEHVKVIGVVNNKINVLNLKDQNQKEAASFMNTENLSSIKTDAKDEYTHCENKPVIKYLEMEQNTENIRYDWDNNSVAINIPIQQCNSDNAEASNIPSQRCDWGNAEASNIPFQRYEWDNNVEASSIQSPLCDWENNAESGNIQSQRSDWDNNTEENNIPTQGCDWDNAEASNIPTQPCDWDNNAEASTIPSQQYECDKAEVSSIQSQRYDWDKAEVSAIPSQRCNWGNNAEASNIPLQRYNHFNSENVYFLQSESVPIVPVFSKNTESRYLPQFKGSLILGMPNQRFDNGMTGSGIYSNQLQSFMNYDHQYYHEQGSGNSSTRQNNPKAIYNSVVNGVRSNPFAISWTDGGVVYFQYYQNVAPVSYPCFVPVVGQNLSSHSAQFVPHFDVNSSYSSNSENTVK